MILEIILALVLLALVIFGIVCLRVAYIHHLYAHIPGPTRDRFVFYFDLGLRYLHIVKLSAP